MVLTSKRAAAGAVALFFGCIALATALMPALAQAPTPLPAPVPANSAAPQTAVASEAERAALVETGRKTYVAFCTRCHGVNMVTTGGIGPDLRKFPADGRERFITGVLKGVRAMPAWEGTIKPEQVDAIWAYVGAVNGW
jgi:cytochrome c55X